MSTIVTRAGKGAPLSNTEMDSNFTNLNSDKLQIGSGSTSSVANRVPYYNSSNLLAISTSFTFDGTTFTTPSASYSGNLTFTGTGNRITGDFSNATAASQVMFQTSTTNGNTRVNAIPNGTGTVSRFIANNNSDSNNAGNLSIGAESSQAVIISGITGTGTYLPLTMYTGGSERLRIDTSGNVGINTTAPRSKLEVVSGAANTNADVAGTAANFTTATPSGQGSSISIESNDAVAANTGGVIGFGGRYNGALYANWASIKGLKDDATVGNYGGYLSFYTRTNGTGSAERMRIDSSGNVSISSTTASTASNNGALVVAGGLGVGGVTNVNNYINRITGSGNSSWLQQDGTGRTHWYWNTYGGGSPVFTNANEDASALSLHITGTGAGGAFFHRSASGVGQAAGAPITWTTTVYSDLNSFTWKGNTVLRSDNYNTYAPTLTGTGASGSWGINVTGSSASCTGNAATATSATSLNSSNYISNASSSGNYNTDFQNTPAGSYRYNGDNASITNNPGGTWWFSENMRHTNASSFWGTQIAWGWEDNANKLAQRNVQGGTFGAWVYYLNSANVGTYALPIGGGTLTGALTMSSSNQINFFSSNYFIRASSGLELQSQDYMRFLTNGANERMRIDSSGNVGIRTSSPAFPLDIQCDSSAFGLRLRGRSDDISVLRFVNNAANTTLGQFDVRSTAFIINAVAAMPMTFNTNNTERMRIDSSGNVGIGSSPSGARLHVYQAVANSPNIIKSETAASGNTFDYATFNAKAVGAAGGIVAWSTGSSRAGQVWVQSDNAVPLVFGQNDTERARIDTNGCFLVGGSTATYAAVSRGTIEAIGAATAIVAIKGGSSKAYFYEAGNGTYLQRDTTSGNLWVVCYTGGVYLTQGATSWAANSDERLKDIIEPITDAVNKVSSLRTVIGKYKTDDENKRRSFLIAQDVQAVFPEAVSVGDDEQGTLGVAYSDLIPLLVASIKEQQVMIEQLKAKVAALEAK